MKPRPCRTPAGLEFTAHTMQTINPKEAATAAYTVLRPICMAGERVEPGASVMLTKGQYAELSSAGKVGAFVAPPAAEKMAKAEPKEAKK